VEEFDLASLLQSLAELLVEKSLTLAGALVVLVLGLTAIRMIRSWVTRTLQRSTLDETLIPFTASLVYYVLLAFVLIAVITMLGIPTTSFVAALGAAGLAIGLALQGTLSNFAGGVMLLVFRPFRIGDYVEAGSVEGKVVEIGVFSTILNSLDNVRIVLPNSTVWGHTIKNYTANDLRRNDITIGISYGDDIQQAKTVIRQVLEEDDRVVTEPAPLVAVQELGDSSVNILVGPWCTPDDYWAVRFDTIEKIKVRLESNGCTIPFPQRDVHLFETN